MVSETAEARRGAQTGLLADVLGCPVDALDLSADALARFEHDHCFLPEVQPHLTAHDLGRAAAESAPGIVRELVDPLGIAVTVFTVSDDAVLIGPYVTGKLTTSAAEALLGRLHVPMARLQPFKLYRARYALVDSEYVMRAAAALLHRTGLPADLVRFRRVAVGGPASSDRERTEVIHSADLDVIDERYAIELEFMQAIADGDEHRALAALQRLSDIPHTSSYLNSPIVSATILRIMTRVAAQHGGLPPVTIDAISQSYAQQLQRSGRTPDPRQTAEAVTAMVHEFCVHVQRYRQRPYSRLVRQVMDDVELHLSSTISPEELARRFHISASHLARTFRAETGMTIARYVAAERCARAARLLVETRQPVQDIAAYVGYADANYFVKVFKSVHGQTPTGYRAQRAA